MDGPDNSGHLYCVFSCASEPVSSEINGRSHASPTQIFSQFLFWMPGQFSWAPGYFCLRCPQPQTSLGAGKAAARTRHWWALPQSHREMEKVRVLDNGGAGTVPVEAEFFIFNFMIEIWDKIDSVFCFLQIYFLYLKLTWGAPVWLRRICNSWSQGVSSSPMWVSMVGIEPT